MNLSLIDEVMMPYLEKRRELSAIEEQKQAAPLGIEWKEDLNDEAMQEWLEHTRAQVKAGKVGVALLTVMLYDWVVEKELIKPTAMQKYEALARASEIRQAQITEECERKPASHSKLREFIKMKEWGEFSGEEVELLKNLAKRIVLFDYLKS